MSGFGTLQELLFLQQHIDRIQPDLLVLQMCTNDFIDNHHGLALECLYEMHEKRPYLQADGEIVQLRSPEGHRVVAAGLPERIGEMLRPRED